LAEYDALPELGHACGHNIIGAAAAGAAMAAKVLVDNLPGTVVVYGTPAEEVFGGKIDMMEHGEFDHVDVAMMTHPDSMNSTVIKALACAEIDVEFTGKAAHAAAEPHLGINALDAMVLSFNNIGALRQHIKHDARIHGIIKYGGNAANIIPEYSSALFMVRASDRGYLEDLQKKIVDCFVGAALATGCQLSYKWGAKTTDPMRNNLTMARLYKNNMELLGRKMEMDEGGTSFGSTDMGNVSQIIPSIHPTVQIVSPGIAVHSREFAAAAISEDGNKGLLDAAKAMAMTVSDIIGNPETLEDIKDEFERSLKEPNLIPRL
jgi:amidohydrolase